MTRGITVEMDSYRLAKYAAQVHCYVCGQGNTFDAELCRVCFAPMALAHQANSQQIRTHMMATIGASGVGKTVYLGMLLDMLSRQPERLHALARGAFSITLQQMAVATMSRGEFPQKTPNEPDRWNWVHCQVRSPRQRKPLELIMPDMAGEALFEEIDHPRTYEVVRMLLEKCSAALVLVDAVALQQGGLEQDYFTMKLVSYLAELVDDPKNNWKNRPIAVVFSKADECEDCFDSPDEFARRYTPGLWQQCAQSLRRVSFFATGVAGCCVSRLMPDGSRRRVPLRIEPRGIVEPFEWLVGHIKA